MLQFHCRKKKQIVRTASERQEEKMEKPQILLLTHGGWGMDLLRGVRMILGEVDCVTEIPLTPELTLADYIGKVTEFARTMPEHSVILTDMFGGTTSNAGAKVGRELNIPVYSGLNAPMLLDACSQIMFDGDLNPQEVLESGQGAAKDVVAEILESLKNKNA